MNNQEAFNAMVTHLSKQKGRALQNGACVYRAKDGKMCAVGAIIPDDEYNQMLEAQPARYAHQHCPSLADLDVEMLQDVQDIHDMLLLEEWECNLMELAQNYDLKTDVLKSCDWSWAYE